MSYFQSICEALGLALSLGVLLAAPFALGVTARALLALAAVAGAVLAAVSVSSQGHSVLLAIPLGAAGALLSAGVLSGIAAGAAERAQAGAGAIASIVAVAAVILALLSILLPPLSLFAAAALLWLGLARRRRAQRKYEGLRILR